MREWISKRFSLAAAAIALAGTPGFSTAVAEESDADVAAETLELLLATPSWSTERVDMPGRFSFPDAHRVPVQTIPAVEFRDGSTLGRLKSIRQLSLLTLTDNGKSRVYLGVNDEGVFGIHLSFLTWRHSDRFAELLRMPYLRDLEQRP